MGPGLNVGNKSGSDVHEVRRVSRSLRSGRLRAGARSRSRPQAAIREPGFPSRRSGARPVLRFEVTGCKRARPRESNQPNAPEARRRASGATHTAPGDRPVARHLTAGAEASFCATSGRMFDLSLGHLKPIRDLRAHRGQGRHCGARDCQICRCRPFPSEPALPCAGPSALRAPRPWRNVHATCPDRSTRCHRQRPAEVMRMQRRRPAS
jgi:hypothetical protein